MSLKKCVLLPLMPKNCCTKDLKITNNDVIIEVNFTTNNDESFHRKRNDKAGSLCWILWKEWNLERNKNSKNLRFEFLFVYTQKSEHSHQLNTMSKRSYIFLLLSKILNLFKTIKKYLRNVFVVKIMMNFCVEALESRRVRNWFSKAYVWYLWSKCF